MKPFNILGLTIFSLGVLILAGFGFYKFVDKFFQDTSIPFLVKIGVVGLVLGIIVMLTSLIIERIRNKGE